MPANDTRAHAPHPGGARFLTPARRRKAREALLAYLFLLPALLILGTFQYLPAIEVFRLSLTDRLLLRPVANFIGFDNYTRMFADERFWNSVWNTVYFVGVSVPLQIALALLLAVVLARKFRGIGIFRTIFFLPVVASMVAVAVVWKWMYHPNIGIFNYFLNLVGASPVRWLQDPTWAMPSVILLAIWNGTGY
jgi:multiple sugar transport system permease protein